MAITLRPDAVRVEIGDALGAPAPARAALVARIHRVERRTVKAALRRRTYHLPGYEVRFDQHQRQSCYAEVRQSKVAHLDGPIRFAHAKSVPPYAALSSIVAPAWGLLSNSVGASLDERATLAWARIMGEGTAVGWPLV